MMLIFIVLYLTLAHAIQTSQALECYSCSGGQECGTLFSPKSINIKKIKSRENERLSSCSITVTSEGLTTRDLVPAHTCRSSSYQFCCNENLCNSLASPPLPPLTSLKCAIGKCSVSDGVCVNDAAYVTVLSSATESCSMTLGKETYKYYKKGCQPTITDASGTRALAFSNANVFCCNSPQCNQELITSAVKGGTLQCYTCDSRITGMAGCMTLNESSPYVYKAGTSSHFESCAVSSLTESSCSNIEIYICKTIIGLEGRDVATGTTYPAFAIRTFISKCVNQPLGTVSYGGAYFQGRIECCSTHFCNTQTLNTTKSRGKFGKKTTMKIASVVVLLIVIVACIGCAIYCVYKKKNNSGFGPVATSEPVSLTQPSERIAKKGTSQQAAARSYPEPSAAP